MRKLLLAATAVVSLGGLAAAGLLTQAGAQPGPPPMAGHPPQGGGWRMGLQAGGWGWQRHAGERMRTFALLYHPDDRHLTAPDVQKIAEAFLLWNGNHTWKVVNVAAGADNQIGFAVATPDGSVIARFTMDAKTGRVTRAG